jgi:transcriptional regulator with PAS, ATPase and Fis domain
MGRRHLELEDLESSNGTWLGHERISRSRLAPDQVALLGRRPLLVARRGPAHAPDDTVIWQGIWARAGSSLALLERAAVLAQLDVPVWIRGETGTGKEGLSRALHFAGPRAAGPWVTLNCAALPESLAEAELFGVARGAFTGADRDRKGAFERAHGGSLLLDEIGELPLTIQAKLLRAVEEGEITPVGGSEPRRVNVRILASTWVDLDRAAAQGRFRFDLLERLSVTRLTLDPLRSRPRDVPALYARFMSEIGPSSALDASTVADLEARPWPGNARSVRAHLMSRVLGDLPSTHPPRSMGPAPSDTHHVAQEAVARHDGNRTSAARALGISRSTLYRWLAAGSGPGRLTGSEASPEQAKSGPAGTRRL